MVEQLRNQDGFVFSFVDDSVFGGDSAVVDSLVGGASELGIKVGA